MAVETTVNENDNLLDDELKRNDQKTDVTMDDNRVKVSLIYLCNNENYLPVIIFYQNFSRNLYIYVNYI